MLQFRRRWFFSGIFLENRQCASLEWFVQRNGTRTQTGGHFRKSGFWDCVFCDVVYYESIKWEPKIRGIYECRCDERLQTSLFVFKNAEHLKNAFCFHFFENPFLGALLAFLCSICTRGKRCVKEGRSSLVQQQNMFSQPRFGENN